MSNGNLKIPYGVSNFMTLRQEGLHFVDKFVPAFVRGTSFHQVVFQFNGSERVRIGQIAKELLP